MINASPNEKQIRDLKQRIIEIDRLVKLVHEQERELTETRKEIQAVTNLNELREFQINQIKQDVKEFHMKLHKADVRNNSLKAQLNMKEMELLELRQIDSDARAIKPKEVEKLRKNLQESQDKNVHLSKKCSDAQQKIRELRASMKSFNKTISTLKKESEEVKSLEEQNMGLLLDLDLSKKKCRDMEVEHSKEINALLARLKKQEDIERSYADMRNVIKSLKEDNRELLKRPREMNEDDINDRCDKRLQTITDCVEQIRVDLSTLRSGNSKRIIVAGYSEMNTIFGCEFFDASISCDLLQHNLQGKGAEMVADEIMGFLESFFLNCSEGYSFKRGPLSKCFESAVKNLLKTIQSVGNFELNRIVLEKLSKRSIGFIRTTDDKSWVWMLLHFQMARTLDHRETLIDLLIATIENGLKLQSSPCTFFPLDLPILLISGSLQLDSSLFSYLGPLLTQVVFDLIKISIRSFHPSLNAYDSVAYCDFQEMHRWFYFIERSCINSISEDIPSKKLLANVILSPKEYPDVSDSFARRLKVLLATLSC